jgi:hypothetical protein
MNFLQPWSLLCRSCHHGPLAYYIQILFSNCSLILSYILDCKLLQAWTSFHSFLFLHSS